MRVRQDAPALPDDGGATPSELARPLGPRELRALHLDLVGRPPFADELEGWSGRPFEELVDALLGSEAFWQHWLDEEFYYFLLIDNFRPATPALDGAAAALASGALDVREVLHRIALSSSFDLRNPGADTFVTVVMEQICGLRVQKRARELEIGKRIYDGAKGSFLGCSGSSQADVVRIAVESEEAAETLARRQYQRYLHALPEAAVLREWTRALHDEPARFAEILRERLLSDDYEERLERKEPMPNRLFVRCLYVDLMGRLPAPEEQEPLREALDGLGDSAPLRSVIARLILDSGRAALPPIETIEDRRAFVAERFRRMLGREATEEELASFTTAMQEPGCRTETVVYAILSHPEYHRY